MKGAKVIVSIMLAVLLIVGWATLTVETGKTIVSSDDGLSTAEIYVKEGLYQRAILKYKEVLAEDSSEKTWTLLFQAYDLRMKEDANIVSDYVVDLQAALALYPKNVAYTQKLYDLYMEMNSVDNAYACLKTAIAAGVKDENIVKLAKELKYSYKVNLNTYAEITSLSADMYLVSKGDKWGYVRANGETLVDFIYDYASSFSNDSIYIVKNALGTRLYNSAGIVLGIFKEDVTNAGLFADNMIPAAVKGKYAYYDAFAKEKFGGYEYAGTFQNGTAAVKKDSQWVLIDTTGKETSQKFADILVDDNGLYMTGSVMVAAAEKGKYQMFDEKGKLADKFAATKMDVCTADGLIAFEQDGKWGFVNTSGKVVIEPAYEQAKSFSNGFAAVCKDGKWGFINTANEVVIDYQFAGADYFNSSGNCMVRCDAANVEDEPMWQMLSLNFGING